MAIDYRLDFLGMDLQSAHIDDAAAAPDVIVALAAQLQEIAGIHEAFGIEQRRAFGSEIMDSGPGRADSKRAVHHFHVHLAARFPMSALVDHARGETFTPVVHLKSDARF